MLKIHVFAITGVPRYNGSNHWQNQFNKLPHAHS